MSSPWPSRPSPGATFLRSVSLRGQEGFASLRCVPSRRAAVITPLGPTRFSCQLPAPGAASARRRGARPCRTVFTRLVPRSIPAARRVAPRPKAGFVRRCRPLLSLLPSVSSASRHWLFFPLGLSPTGLHRLPGHAVHVHVPVPVHVLDHSPSRLLASLTSIETTRSSKPLPRSCT